MRCAGRGLRRSSTCAGEGFFPGYGNYRSTSITVFCVWWLLRGLRAYLYLSCWLRHKKQCILWHLFIERLYNKDFPPAARVTICALRICFYLEISGKRVQPIFWVLLTELGTPLQPRLSINPLYGTIVPFYGTVSTDLVFSWCLKLHWFSS